jgi:hypothetical protein
MLFERGGVQAIKAALAGGYSDDALKVSLQRELKRSWVDLQRDWHARAVRP